MKQINLQNADYKEVIVTKSDLSILYVIRDDLGAIIFEKRLVLKKEDLPQAGQNALENLLEKLLEKVVLKEL
jgi:hypothetical protein